jgi:hypothetical protein
VSVLVVIPGEDSGGGPSQHDSIIEEHLILEHQGKIVLAGCQTRHDVSSLSFVEGRDLSGIEDQLHVDCSLFVSEFVVEFAHFEYYFALNNSHIKSGEIQKRT